MALNNNENVKKQLDFKSNIKFFVETFVDEIIVSKIDGNRNDIKLDIFLNLIKKPPVNTRGSKYIDKIDEKLSVYSNSCGTLDLGRADFKRNSFCYNVYINKFNEKS